MVLSLIFFEPEASKFRSFLTHFAGKVNQPIKFDCGIDSDASTHYQGRIIRFDIKDLTQEDCFTLGAHWNNYKKNSELHLNRKYNWVTYDTRKS